MALYHATVTVAIGDANFTNQFPHVDESDSSRPWCLSLPCDSCDIWDTMCLLPRLRTVILLVSAALVLAGVGGPSVATTDAVSAAAPADKTVASSVRAIPAATSGGWAGGPPDNYTPRAGAKFNNPLRGKRAQYRLFRHINRQINSAPRGSAIRMAVFSFADGHTADNLIRAHRRGVKVKLVFDRHEIYPAMRKLRRGLGSDIQRRSFAVFCKQSCRARGGEMHAKVYLFSRSGRARKISMIGSNNMTSFNAEHQWSDLVTMVGNRTMYVGLGDWFNELKRDRPVDNPRRFIVTPSSRALMLPQDTSVHGDPALRVLNRVYCQLATPLRRTRVLISAHAWYGPRGYRIAERVAELSRNGCVVRVIRGEAVGRDVRRVMRRSGVEIRRSTHRGVKTHQKLLLVRGGFEQNPRSNLVWTGSHNWSPLALGLDDAILRISNRAWVRDYRRHFNTMFRKG